MTAELLLLRHGKSDWKTELDDFYRPLTDRGKRGVQRIGTWLVQNKLAPDHVISSPAERAQATARECCNLMGGCQSIQFESRVYAADTGMLLTVLADCPEQAGRVLLVGHNPGLEQLLNWLVDGNIPLPEDGKLLPTATLARLKIDQGWNSLKQGCAALESITRPDDLPKKFPFLSPSGTEWHDRPAYYYNQSSVIPWRMRQGEIEILVVLSKNGKHWVVPKGVWEPELTARDSAAKEALEEAGVEGRVAETAIGTYTYPKWGGVCTVEVYPMEVTHVLADKDWQESHRSREWVSPDEAVNRLKQDELKPMVQGLANMGSAIK